MWEIQPSNAETWQRLLTAGTLLTVRLGCALAFAPPFNSPAIPMRIKSSFTLAMVVLLTPLAASLPHAEVQINVFAVLGEVGIGLLFGATLALLNESLLFAGSIMSMSFSFSLANLMDPNSRVETPVLGTLVAWLGTLVLLGAGLHRVVLGAIIRSLAVVPLGTVSLKVTTLHGFVEMAGGIFLAGLQLSAPVLSAVMTVEVAVALMARMAPSLPSQVLSVPVKTLVAYVVLIASLAVWPRWIEGRFDSLLDAAQRMVIS